MKHKKKAMRCSDKGEKRKLKMVKAVAVLELIIGLGL